MKQKLAVCVTFFYRKSRLPYLEKTIRSLSSISSPIDLFIISNVSAINDQNFNLDSFPEHVKIHWTHVQVSGHPLLLTWAHYDIWQKLDLSVYSHYLYLEDDISFGSANFHYWCKWREILRPHCLIPGFVRYEFNSSGSTRYATDICAVQFLPALPGILAPGGCKVVNLFYPYQGMYLFDRELLLEFLSSSAFSPNHGIWKIQEKAAQGLTFCNVPKGYYCRIGLPVDIKRRLIVQDALVEHSCAAYVNNRASRLAKIPVDRIFGRVPSYRFLLRSLVVRILDSYLFRHRN